MAKEEEEIIVDVEQAYSNTEKWVIDNQKSLSIILGAVVLLFGSYFAFKNFILQPQEEEAKEYIWQAQQAFAKDSFNLAVNGNESMIGFLDIIDNYGMTESANLANYYTGVSYLRMGQYEDAIEYLNNFDCKDILVCASALGATGDAYLELGDTEKAIDYYNNAIDHSENELTTPFYLKKLGLALELNGEYDKAVEAYTDLKEEYPQSQEASGIEKYIARAEGKAKA